MRRIVWAMVMTLGCGGAAEAPNMTVASPTTLPPSAQAMFDDALAELVLHERSGDWNPASCAKVAAAFDAVVRVRRTFPVASFNAGVALERCNMDADALIHFERALAGDPTLHVARAHIALQRYKADGDLDKAIGALQQAAIDAQFQNVPALVDLAALQMKRAGNGDLDAAKTNVERALAVDDSYMPAFNQMALYHLAKKNTELAALVASQGIKKNATYAPIYNTAGLAQLRLGRVNTALELFMGAMQRDPRLFEAPMNFAQVNLSFRGYEPAEKAFRRAIAIRPNDYDAHLGLALALRGQINERNEAAQIAAVREELEACKRIDRARPEAYYNEGILTQEFEARSASNPAAVMQRAIGAYGEFKARAAGKTEYAAAVKTANDRIDDAIVTRDFSTR